MEIDLDNWSSAARMKRKSATRSVWKKRTKARAIVADDDCGDACKI